LAPDRPGGIEYASRNANFRRESLVRHVAPTITPLRTRVRAIRPSIARSPPAADVVSHPLFQIQSAAPRVIHRGDTRVREMR